MAPFGLVDEIIERHGGRGKSMRQGEPGWIDGLRASGRLAAAGAARVNREGDIYEMFAVRPEGVEVLVRAAQVPEGAGKLFSSLADRPEKEHAIELPARPGQRKREARIAVRFGAVLQQACLHLSRREKTTPHPG